MCRRLRDDGARVPILIVTGRDAVADRIAGLEAGADDYLVKPFSTAELVARVRALLRRGRDLSAGTTSRFADLTLDASTREVRRGGRPVTLDAARVRPAGAVHGQPRGGDGARPHPGAGAWGGDLHGTRPARWTSTLATCGESWRRRGEPRLLHTVRGVGYQLRLPPEPEPPRPLRSVRSRTSSPTRAGSALPPVAFIAWPTKNPTTLSLPSRSCCAWAGFVGQQALDDRDQLALVGDLAEALSAPPRRRAAAPVRDRPPPAPPSRAAPTGCGRRAGRAARPVGRRHPALPRLLAELAQLGAQLAADPVGGGLRVGLGGHLLEPGGQLRRLGQHLGVLERQPELVQPSAGAARPAAPAGPRGSPSTHAGSGTTGTRSGSGK